MSVDFTGQNILQYRIKERLKERPLSSLYLAEDKKGQKPVYLEISHVTIAEDEEQAGQFQRRMTTVSQLDHPHIVPVVYIGLTNEKRPYAVMEYIPGQFFAGQIATWQETNSWPSPLTALHLIQPLAEALALAHPAGLIHHDLRPANILLDSTGKLMLLDLGVLPTNQVVKLEIVPGQPYYLDYASPEQQNGQALSGPSNIYSLGIMLYQLLSGSMPVVPLSQWSVFERPMLPKELPLAEVRPGLSEATYTLVKNCLWRQEWNRYETIQQFLVDLDLALAAEKSGPRPKPVHISQGNRKWIFAGVGLGILAVTLLIIALFLLRG